MRDNKGRFVMHGSEVKEGVKERRSHLFARKIMKAKKGEIVHHKDGNPFNNKIENLEIYKSQKEHLSIGHKENRVKAIKKICITCGKKFIVKISSKQKNRYCSKKCFFDYKKGKPFSGIQGHPFGGYNRDWKSEGIKSA